MGSSKISCLTLTSEAETYYTTKAKQNVVYNAFKSPLQIEEVGVDKLNYTYNDGNSRSAMFYGSLDDDKLQRPLRKYYSADSSMEIKHNIVTGDMEFVTYIGGDGYSAPIVLKSDGTTQNWLYLHRDYQGSILAITNDVGTILEKRLFDAWGAIVEKRLFDAWGAILKVQDGAGNIINGLTILDRGYTGHEHLQSVGLIHMNGRLYDPKLHRFLQPDNYVQDPYNTQNFNRFGYVLNNPLKYIDPSGESFKSWWRDNWKNIAIMTAAVIVGVAIAVATAGAGTGLSVILISGVEAAVASGTIWAGALGGAIMGASIIHGLNKSKPDNGSPNQGGSSSNGVAQNNPVVTPKTQDNVKGNESCSNCLNPSTVGHNLLGLTYPGANNPKSYNRAYNYSYVPTNLAEYPAIGHDRRYDKLKITGASGLFTDTRAIGADWQFVGEQFNLATNPYLNPVDRLSAGALGIGLGISALPKTIYQMATGPMWLGETIMWYNISNQGVNNAPTIHKH